MHLTFKFVFLPLVSLIMFCQLSCKNEMLIQDKIAPKPTTTSKKSEKNIGFSCFPSLPEFPGGNKRLMQYLAMHISYPTIAKNEGIEGTVIVSFLIEEDGSIGQVKAIGQPLGGGLEKEAVQVVKNMPYWKPAINFSTNKPISTQFSISIRFKLNHRKHKHAN